MLDANLTDEELWGILPTMAVEDIPSLMAHPMAKEQHILKLLIRRDLPEQALGMIAHSRWVGTLRMQAALVNHPSTPLPTALNFVKFLFWRDLNAVTMNFRLAAEVRHLAESILFQRLPALAIGEKVSLARMAGGQVIKTLRLDKDPKVIEALLENPRLVESDVLYLICQTRTPAPVLEAVARDPKWSARREVRVALLRNAKTPMGLAISFVSRLTATEAQELLNDSKVPLALRRMIKTKLGRG